MTKKTNNPAKAKAWKTFSRYVRIRDCLETTGLPFVGICVTCDKCFHISALQAGHCLSGRRNARLCNEKLVFAQCNHCNLTLNGRPKRYRKRMIEKYGQEEFDRMVVESKKIIHDRDMDFEGIEKEYKERLIRLMRDFGYKTYSELLQEGK